MSQEKLPPEVASQVFTTAQLAARYSQSPLLILKMMDEGWLPYINYSQKTRIIPIKAIEAFEDETSTNKNAKKVFSNKTKENYYKFE